MELKEKIDVVIQLRRNFMTKKWIEASYDDSLKTKRTIRFSNGEHDFRETTYPADEPGILNDQWRKLRRDLRARFTKESLFTLWEALEEIVKK